MKWGLVGRWVAVGVAAVVGVAQAVVLGMDACRAAGAGAGARHPRAWGSGCVRPPRALTRSKAPQPARSR